MSNLSIKRAEIGVLLIDVQPFFLELMAGSQEPVLARIEHLLMLTAWFELPLIVTFEHPVEKKGMLPERLEKVFPPHGQRFVKRSYGCCAEEIIRNAMRALSIRQFAVAGGETDVCVLQSVLGLLSMRYQVFLLEDCLFTSEPQPGPALQRMYQSGANPCTFKTLAYELAGNLDETPWLEYQQPTPHKFPDHFMRPEALPPGNPRK